MSHPGFFWVVKAPPNTQTFAWRVLLVKVPTRDNLARREIMYIWEENGLTPFLYMQNCS